MERRRRQAASRLDWGQRRAREEKTEGISYVVRKSDRGASVRYRLEMDIARDRVMISGWRRGPMGPADTGSGRPWVLGNEYSLLE